METKNQNTETGLSSLQMQYKALQEKFNQQEIVNNCLIQEMLKAGTAGFRRRLVEIVLTYGLLAATVCWSWYRFDLHLYFMIVSVVLFIAMGVMEWASCCKVIKTTTDNIDLQILEGKMKGFRTNFTLLWILGVFLLCLWMMWFIVETSEKRMLSEFRDYFVLLAGILPISIILILWNINRLTKEVDNLVSQTSRLSGSDASQTPSFHRGSAYWAGVVMSALNLLGLFFKLMHWPYANLILLVMIVAGLVFVWLTCRNLVLIVPREKLFVRIFGWTCLLLFAYMVFLLFGWPMPPYTGLVALALFVVAGVVLVSRAHIR